MDKNVMIYQPYYSCRFFFWVLAIFSVAGTVLFGRSLDPITEISFLLLVLVLLCAICTQKLYIASKILVLFELDGLRIIGDKDNKHIYLSWQSIKTIEKTKNWRGFHFYVISTNILNEKELSKLVHKSRIEKVSYSGTILLYVDKSQNTEMWECLLEGHRTGDGSKPLKK